MDIPTEISIVVSDFDGVMTDNRVLVFSDGTEAVYCNRSDGLGIRRLLGAGFDVFVLSAEMNPVVLARANKLGIPALTGKLDKLSSLRQWAKENKRDLSEMLFVGNDTNDMECMRAVKIGVAVADAREGVRECADIVLSTNGGDGVMQEIADLLIPATSDKRV